MSRLLQDWLRDQAERKPEAAAVVMYDQLLTYGDLEARSNQLARLLKANGCKRGDRIGLAIPKSFAAIIGLFGILKADCVHVPIDTRTPARRIAKIILSSEPRYILGAGSVTNVLDEVLASKDCRQPLGVGWLGTSPPNEAKFVPAFCWNDLQSQCAEFLDSSAKSEDAALILFTSGSTGDPKGVVITHSNIIHFVEWAVKYFSLERSDKISCHPPLSFDLCYGDIFNASASGAQLHLVPPELNLLPHKIAEFIRNSELTLWFSVPSVLTYMAKFDAVKHRDFATLKRVLWCGEVFATPALMYWMKRLPDVKFTNLYGPTEATIASSYYTVRSCPSDKKVSVPIGTACDGEELLVLDEQLRPTFPGEVGDLYIRGVGLSPGYWRDSQKTLEVFLPYGTYGTDRIYRTGDLARIGEDGLVYFVGRADSQIKCRGYRIELGDVEAALRTLAGVRDCAVVAIPTDGFEGHLICCAFAPSNRSQIPIPTLREMLSKHLPGYMLPSRWMLVNQLPINSNGKIDRRTLMEWFTKNEQEMLLSERISK